MQLSRRSALQLLAAAAPAFSLRGALAQTNAIQITPGQFTNTRESLRAYTIPDWFGDAKFGIWAHWGPQSAIGDGDWYARNMYVEGQPQYDYHRKRFGPQSKVGYKDLIHLYTADQWDPEHLMDLYVKAGAKYFFSMGVHHDGYDLWNSKYQPRWNSVASGPKKDVVGLWAAAARKRGLRFGVSEHLSNSFDWLAPSHLADTKGEFANVPYDGQDPAYSDLYHDFSTMPPDFAKTAEAMGRVAPDSWKIQYYRRVKDLLDQHQPDLLYTDGGISMEEYSLATIAELYNVGGVLDNIAKLPWQTDTCIGQWHYKEGGSYKSPKKVIDLLVDIVSKNGNLLLNIPLPASGLPDDRELAVLEGITQWMSVNGEGIFHTRPWTINGEGPAMNVVIKSNGKEFDPNEGKKPDLTAQDIRFTTKGKSLFAFVQGWPASEVVIASLGTKSPQNPAKVLDVRLLGHTESLRFTQEAAGLRVSLPSAKPTAADIGICLRVNFA
jgi:alpha-L-fucosidase